LRLTDWSCKDSLTLFWQYEVGNHVTEDNTTNDRRTTTPDTPDGTAPTTASTVASKHRQAILTAIAQYAVLVCHTFPHLTINSDGLFTRDTATGQFIPVTDNARVEPSNAYLSFRFCRTEASTNQRLNSTTFSSTVQKWTDKQWRWIDIIATGHSFPQATTRQDVSYDDTTHSLYVSIHPIIEAPDATMQYCFTKSRRAAIPIIGLLAVGAGMIGADAYIHLGPAPKEPPLSPEARAQRDQLAAMRARLKHPPRDDVAFQNPADGSRSDWNSPKVNKIVAPLELAAMGAAGAGIAYAIGKKYPQFDNAASCDTCVPSSEGPPSQAEWRDFATSISRQIDALSIPAPEPKAPPPKSWIKRVLGGGRRSRNESDGSERG